MSDTENTYAAVHWEPSEEGDHLVPEVLVVRASNIEQAQAAFQAHLAKYNLNWDPYSLEWHAGEGVAQLMLDPPEPEDPYESDYES